MPLRDRLLDEAQGEHHYGILLAVQVGGVPNELQLMIETAEYDEKAQGLRPKGGYIIRALGVREHRVTLGVFATMSFSAEHPLLYHHNKPQVEIRFEGMPANINECVLDISQAYLSTFGPWRQLGERDDELNRDQPLVPLLASGGGLLGAMPQPAAEAMAKVMRHHGLQVTLTPRPMSEQDEHGRSRLAQALFIDHTYVIALDFSVDAMGKRA
jgi:hypothetical protein